MDERPQTQTQQKMSEISKLTSMIHMELDKLEKTSNTMQTVFSDLLMPLNTESAESKKEFIHKMGICLKELRETHNCMKIIKKAKLTQNHIILENLEKEVNELISIFVSSIKTSKSNI